MNNFTTYQNKSIPFLAEVVCACLIEQGLSPEQVTVNLKGAFKKTFSNDIDNLFIDDETKKAIAEIDINRNGWYDILPEGIFHQTHGMHATRSVRDAVAEHRRYAEEERYARKFFAPLETMIFWYRVQAELSERNALYNVANEQLTNSLLDFWNIERSLPKIESLRMLTLMPFMDQIKGDKFATTDALSFILSKDVYIEEAKRRTVTDQRMSISLDDMFLGANSVIGTNCDELIYGWQININDIPTDMSWQFTDSAPMGRILNKFKDIFIPVDRDIYFEFCIAKSPAEAVTEYVLGYGCTI